MTDIKGLGLDRTATSNRPNLIRHILRTVIHRLSYQFIYEHRRTRLVRAAGFDLIVRPTVFHPRWFLTSEYFAQFINELDLSGKHVAEVGTGSGILALAAARAGATTVVAIDINPHAAQSASENARANGFGDCVHAVCGNLLSPVAPQPLFDVILSSPPSFAGEPLDVADRAWHAGPAYRDITGLFEQARDRLKPDGRLYVLFSSDSDLQLMGGLADQAGFKAKLAAKRSIVIESLLIFELSMR